MLVTISVLYDQLVRALECLAFYYTRVSCPWLVLLSPHTLTFHFILLQNKAPVYLFLGRGVPQQKRHQPNFSVLGAVQVPLILMTLFFTAPMLATIQTLY